MTCFVYINKNFLFFYNSNKHLEIICFQILRMVYFKTILSSTQCRAVIPKFRHFGSEQKTGSDVMQIHTLHIYLVLNIMSSWCLVEVTFYHFHTNIT